MCQRAAFRRRDAAHPAVPREHGGHVRQCREADDPEESDGDQNDDLSDDDFVPPEFDDAGRWDDFGADFDDEEPDPERGDFCTDDDPLDEER
ncbi:MAG: hypothetical protein HYX69_12330 [Planctomycetia bacterium]|nr:hypothetical protein [Planctomycetia bacterium]